MTALSVKDLNPALGAEVSGLEPKQPLDEDTIRELRDLFDQRGALVFRNLDIDESFQRYLVYTLIGEEPPAKPAPDRPRRERSLPPGVLGVRLTARPSGAPCPGREEGPRTPADAADAAIGDRSERNRGRRDLANGAWTGSAMTFAAM